MFHASRIESQTEADHSVDLWQAGRLAPQRTSVPSTVLPGEGVVGQLVQTSSKADIISFGTNWDRLAALQAQYVPSFADVTQALSAPDVDMRLVGWQVGDTVAALAVFMVYKTVRRFWLGEKPVLQMPVTVAELYGSASLGSVDGAAAKAMLESVASDRKIDLLTFADVPQTDSFYRILAGKAWPGPVSISHHRATRRLARLPATMAEYWDELRPTTRKAGQRDLRMFERLGPEYIVMTEPHQVAEFLSRAAKLSDRTYQKKLNVGIEDTEQKRQHFERLASEGRLRCYLATVDGADVAFAWGDISHGVFYYRTTGFDPDFARHSPGKAILLEMIRDLIESKAAHTFDFSGRDTDTKERFSTSFIECANFVAAPWSRLRGTAAVWLDQAFILPKTLAPRLLGNERMQRLRRALRR